MNLDGDHLQQSKDLYGIGKDKEIVGVHCWCKDVAVLGDLLVNAPLF